MSRSEAVLAKAGRAMRHATVNATRVLHDWTGDMPVQCQGRRACDWERMGDSVGYDMAFNDQEARTMLHGRDVTPPTCPACAALLDLALELRGSAGRR